ncbi:hypothetical protein CHS0354_023371 [Potamilus streckersoni]|uniref:Ankyrin repeat domain-containing protein 39 n=1 Tax=Potamilus streckersoni TaxID=2493646 RepID=A0AAE0T4P0_9BIVA|nr:hypothetical protein CHS0354_023371 [Potamilus streckersoni]
MDHIHDGNVCHCQSANPSVVETMDELDFTRGIWISAVNGLLDEVTQMLAEGTDPNATDSFGYTALHYAARNGHYAVCELLLQRGANPDIKTKSGGITSLHRACYQGHLKIVQILLEYKADPLASDSDGKIPLHKAAENGQVEIVKLLIDQEGKAVSVADNKGRLPLDCVSSNHPELRELLQSRR